jgi:transposase
MSRKLEKNALSANQLKAIEMLIDIENNYTRSEIAAKVKVSEATLYNWLKKPEFLEELNKASEEFFRSSLYKVNEALLKKTEKGDTAAMRLYYEKLNDFKQKHELSGGMNINVDWGD